MASAVRQACAFEIADNDLGRDRVPVQMAMAMAIDERQDEGGFVANALGKNRDGSQCSCDC